MAIFFEKLKNNKYFGIDFMIMVNSIVFVILFVFNIYYVIHKLSFKLYILHPINVVSLYLLVFFIIPILIGDFFVPASLEPIYWSLKEYILELDNIILIMYIILTLMNVYFLNKKYTIIISKTNKNKLYGNILEVFIIFYILIIIVILALLISRSGGLNTVINNFAYFTMQARNGNTLLLMAIYTVELLPIVYIIFTRKLNRLFLGILIGIAMFFVTFVGARTLVLSIVISLLLLFIVKYNISLKRISIFFLLFIFFFIVSSTIRSNGYGSTKSLTESVNKLVVYFSHNLDQLATSLLVFYKIENHEIDFQYGRTGIDAIYFFIPKSIFPAKPKSYYPSRLIYPKLTKAGVEQNVRDTFNFGMIARPYLDFGFIGIVLLNIILFRFLLYIYYKIIFTLHSLHKYFQVLYVYIFAHIHQIYILGFWSHIVSIIIFNAVIIFIIFKCFDSFKKIIPRKNIRRIIYAHKKY